MEKPVVQQLSVVKFKTEKRVLTVYGKLEESYSLNSLMSNGFEIKMMAAAGNQVNFVCYLLLEKITEESVGE